MNPKVYIESSVVSYLTARPSRDIVVAGRQAVTHDWWQNHRKRFDLFISVLVESCGFQCPLLCSPEELGGVSND
ncbi:MAG: hypothetical protein PF904_20970 [Kiritimatiellae bacterium]|nr:hypothetical protein [Kiritimatiellia bacterium]